jgi:hypothetical protein
VQLCACQLLLLSSIKGYEPPLLFALLPHIVLSLSCWELLSQAQPTRVWIMSLDDLETKATDLDTRDLLLIFFENLNSLLTGHVRVLYYTG